MKHRWPYVAKAVDEEYAALSMSPDGEYGPAVSALYAGSQMICQTETSGMSFEAIMDELEELAKRYFEDGIITDRINGGEYEAD